MPSITIDGKVYEYDAAKDNYLLQFCLDRGVEVPYFCYHPAMSVPTNCRMCLVNVGFPMKDRATGELLKDDTGNVKIGWGRKPNTSCNTALAPDMVVETGRTSPVIKKAQEGVLEFLLINHPLDCPICDQAGECPLQIWTYKYGPEGSRFEVAKVHKPKRIELGPNVTLDAERCINCTRCTRFTEEISKTNQLSIHARGDKNYPATAPGHVFDDAYSMNVIDICPVGALTSTDHRFKARVWEMSYTPTLCTGCSRGCSIDAWVRDNQVMRLTPRHNPAINDYWMCDEGRLDYVKYNERRVSGPKAKGDLPLEFEEALTHVSGLLRTHKGKTLFIGSAHASLESLHALKTLAQESGAADVYYARHDQPGWGDSLLRQDDRTPNRAAAELLGLKAATPQELHRLISSENITLVYLMEDDALAAELAPLMAEKTFVVHAWQYFAGCDNAYMLLPAATHLEAPGTFINSAGVAQLTEQALQIRRMTPEMWMHMSKSRIDSAGVPIDNWRSPENIVDCLPSWVMLSKLSLETGGTLAHADHTPYFQELKRLYPAPLANLTKSTRPRKESFKQSQFEFAIGR